MKRPGGGRSARRWGRLLRVAPLMAVAMGLAACGAGDPGPAARALTSALATPQQAQQPAPAGATTHAPATGASTAPPTCTNPRASLRPSGPLPAAGHMPSGTWMQTIQQRGYLIAGVDENTKFFGYRNPATGQIEGFDIDLLKAVAKAIFGDENRIQYVVLTSAERIPAIQSGRVDIVADSMTENCERWQQVDFTTDYLDAGQELLVPVNSTITSYLNVGGKRICAAGGTTSIGNLANAGAIPVAVQNWGDCLVMLQQGQVDAISTDDTVLIGLQDQDPYTKLIGPRFSDEPHAMAIAQQHPEFVRFANAVLDQMRSNGSWMTLYNTWLSGRPYLQKASGPPPALYRD